MVQKLYVIINKNGKIARGGSKNTLATFVSKIQAERQFHRYAKGDKEDYKIVEYVHNEELFLRL